MIQQISYYISKAGIISAAGKTEDERRRLSEMPTPAAFVSYAPSLPALVGWYGHRVAFNGVGRVQLEAALDSLRRHFRLRDVREWFDRYSGFYVVEALFAVRMNLPSGVFGGAQSAPVLEDYLNFTMPNGGTITLTRNGSPTVVELEYSLDNRQTWTDWQEVGNVRTLTLTAGQTMWLRNKSETQTGFNTGISDYYQFAFTDTVEAHGNINSLLCRNTDSVISLIPFCYFVLFSGCYSLISAPELPATTLADSCYRTMFDNCDSLISAPELPATTLADSCYRNMFYNSHELQEIRTQMTDITAENCLFNWAIGVAATGDFYCPAELTIPTGASGIPSGWTRHDI